MKRMTDYNLIESGTLYADRTGDWFPLGLRIFRFGSRLTNARSETVLEKPAFKECFRDRRCLILADGFYEWKKYMLIPVPGLLEGNSTFLAFPIPREPCCLGIAASSSPHLRSARMRTTHAFLSASRFLACLA
jgi:SOS response associated peptidase (SRAP)